MVDLALKVFAFLFLLGLVRGALLLLLMVPQALSSPRRPRLDWGPTIVRTARDPALSYVDQQAKWSAEERTQRQEWLAEQKAASLRAAARRARRELWGRRVNQAIFLALGALAVLIGVWSSIRGPK